MEGVPPSSMEDDSIFTSNQFGFQASEDNFNMSELPSLSPEKVQVNQSSILCNDQAGQNRLVDNNDSIQQTTKFPQTMIEGVPPSFMDDLFDFQAYEDNLNTSGHPSPRQFPYQLNQVPITSNPYDPQSSTMLPESSQTLRFSQLPPHNLQVFGDHNDSTLFEPTSSSRLQNSIIHQPQLGHVYMTPNATTSQHGGFNQPAPRIQCIPYQGQVDQADMIPNIDNMQQENLVPRNFGKSTRSQMDNLQVRRLQNRAARPNASHPGPDSSLQSQNRGLNTQQVKRAGPRDPFSNYVEEKDDESMICKFCQRRWANKIPISRFKWHLSGEEGHGVAICPSVNKEVQEEALKAMRSGNKRHKHTTSSINVNYRGISTCPQEQNIKHENIGGGIGRVQREVQAVDTGTEQVHNAQDKIRVWTEPVEEVVLKKSERSAEQAAAGARSTESMKSNKTRGVPFPTSSNKPVGQAFEENTKVLWSPLMDDEVSTIGIYGMGGVGKTTLLQHIHNELLERPDICDHIWWVTVSQDFSINRLQNLIAKLLNLDLSSEDDDSHRAAKLSKELRKKQKWILILDDLWNSFEPHDVGIHSSFKGCKLILTTRSQTVCDQIDCQHKIEVKPLFEGESWTLFKENLGHHITLSDEVEEIAKAVARECAGLPLGIITIARSLRGVDDLPEWRTTLMKLRELKFRDMDEKVFKVLRVSYDRLDDGLALKQCFLYCALFPEDHMIEREELIDYLIDEGIIKGMRSRQDAFDEGHTMLNRLQYVCLLESVHRDYDDKRCVKMHDMIRDMAIQILQENSQVIVKAGAQLEELPDAEEWMENLTIVSLMQNKFVEIPPSHSPMCPNLSTLLLCQNYRLRFIADSFFKQLHGLKVLDLSYTIIENLPNSVSDLVSLTTLLLIDCWMLRDVPSLKKLRALKRLNLSGTTLEKMPEGMECLRNLRYLRMNGCGEKEFPSGILPKLSHLQVFVLENIDESYAVITVKGKEVGSLRNLETLECHFEGLSDFAEYLRSQNGIQSLRTCRISVGTANKCHFYYLPSKTVLLGNCNINADRDTEVEFLNGIQGLHCESFDARSLCDVLSLENATELEMINIESCDSMESLVSSSWFCSATLPLPSHNGMFSHLKEFHCDGCENMKKLFPLELLSYLVNLEVICVVDCEKMEEMIGTADEESSTSNPIAELTLPKLTTLELLNLPELKGICSAKLICNSLEKICLKNCEKLKRMEISLPLLENGQPSPHPSLKRIAVYPKEWWETVVEWEPPNTKEVLRPIVHFSSFFS